MILLTFMRCIVTPLGIWGMTYGLSERRNHAKLRSFITAILFLAGACFMTSIYIFAGTNVAFKTFLPLLFITVLLLMYFNFSDSWPVLLFNLFTQMNIYLGIIYVSDFFGILVTGTNECNWYILIFRTVLFVTAIIVEIMICRKPFRKIVDMIEQEWILAMGMSFIFFLLQICLGIYPIMYYFRPGYNYVTILVSYILMVIVYYCFFVTVYHVVLRKNDEQMKHLMNKKLQFLEQEIIMQKLSMENVSRMRHDMRHECIAAIGMIRNEDYEDAIDFIKQFVQHVDDYNIKSYCENTAVNCILSALSEQASKKQILISIKVNVPASLDIEEVELASLFANTFENSIEGCIESGIEKPFIRIVSDFQNGRFILSVKNTCGTVKFHDHMPVSKKKNGGTGTKSIIQIAEKYHGMAEFSVDKQVFITQVILYV